MDRFNIPRVAEALATHAIEWEHGFQRHQPPGSPPWPEQRRFWTDAILQGMARLDGAEPDPKWMEQYDRELEEARGCYFIIPATLATQRDTILSLRRYVAALEGTGQDRRRQVLAVRDLLEDMDCHQLWGGMRNGLDVALDATYHAVLHMTARLPIRFTRVLLGGDTGPFWECGFVSGTVTDAEQVRKTTVYESALQKHPEIKEWPVICTVCVGHGLDSAYGTVDAGKFDLKIMNHTGDHFLKERGVRVIASKTLLVSVVEQSPMPETRDAISPQMEQMM